MLDIFEPGSVSCPPDPRRATIRRFLRNRPSWRRFAPNIRFPNKTAAGARVHRTLTPAASGDRSRLAGHFKGVDHPHHRVRHVAAGIGQEAERNVGARLEIDFKPGFLAFRDSSRSIDELGRR